MRAGHASTIIIYDHGIFLLRVKAGRIGEEAVDLCAILCCEYIRLGAPGLDVLSKFSPGVGYEFEFASLLIIEVGLAHSVVTCCGVCNPFALLVANGEFQHRLHFAWQVLDLSRLGIQTAKADVKAVESAEINFAIAGIPYRIALDGRIEILGHRGGLACSNVIEEALHILGARMLVIAPIAANGIKSTWRTSDEKLGAVGRVARVGNVWVALDESVNCHGAHIHL